jgi:hypothetical protein
MFPEGGQTMKHCFLAMFPEGGLTREHCFLAMFPEGGQTMKHCFLAMFPEGGQTRKHCFLAMFPEGEQTRKHCFLAMFPKKSFHFLGSKVFSAAQFPMVSPIVWEREFIEGKNKNVQIFPQQGFKSSSFARGLHYIRVNLPSVRAKKFHNENMAAQQNGLRTWNTSFMQPKTVMYNG